MGSREEREREKLGNVRKLTSDDALPRFCVAETADPCRLDQKQPYHVGGTAAFVYDDCSCVSI